MMIMVIPTMDLAVAMSVVLKAASLSVEGIIWLMMSKVANAAAINLHPQEDLLFM